ncbi:hypothetical protein [Endozoicomonas arenosclerae]|uniref:hypothetical protein n=1 Tax=Endozoicomonas arenosclerae TaxID=1633495 RepID=UPI000783162A|nr:hypothetical protein [Endozoicomonas arenosclerae]
MNTLYETGLSGTSSGSLRLFNRFLASLLGMLMLILAPLSHAEEGDVCWESVVNHNTYTPSAISDALSGSDDVPQCVVEDDADGKVYFGYVEPVTEDKLYGCWYYNGNNEHTYSYVFEALIVKNYTELDNFRRFKFDSPQGVTPQKFYTTFKGCQQTEEYPDMEDSSAFDVPGSEQMSIGAAGSTAVSLPEYSVTASINMVCMGTASDNGRGYIYIGSVAQRNGSYRCAQNKVRYYKSVKQSSAGSQQADHQSAQQAAPAPQAHQQDKKCKIFRKNGNLIYVGVCWPKYKNGFGQVKPVKPDGHAANLETCLKLNQGSAVVVYDNKGHCLGSSKKLKCSGKGFADPGNIAYENDVVKAATISDDDCAVWE